MKCPYAKCSRWQNLHIYLCIVLKLVLQNEHGNFATKTFMKWNQGSNNQTAALQGGLCHRKRIVELVGCGIELTTCIHSPE